MAGKSGKKPIGVWGLSQEPLLIQSLSLNGVESGKQARVHVDVKKKSGTVSRTVESERAIEIELAPLAAPETESDARLKASSSMRIREAVGASVLTLEKLEPSTVEYHFNCDEGALEAALTGLEMALYRFKRVYKNEPGKFKISVFNKGKAVSEKVARAAAWGGQAVNLARHLVNLPPNVLNPVSYAEACESLFSGLKGVSVEVWDEKRLEKEGCRLHLGVGQGSATPPRLVHIRYRNGGAKKGPVAFVGKGITFDTGGLDLKPSSGMRLMKKDMGGSAAVLAVAYWAAHSGYKGALDFYLAMAENAVNGNSYRPSDIIVSRNGVSVEIHNTDAEGRLVLADAMDVASTQKDKPRAMIDVATLTGAIKTALGSGLAGLFSTDAKLSKSVADAGQRVGDLSWVMPLYQKYRSQLSSPFADQVNSADGFGGAITAALFLEKFARDIPWAHLDVYSWKDGPEGACCEPGGSGQAVLGLVEWLGSQR